MNSDNASGGKYPRKGGGWQQEFSIIKGQNYFDGQSAPTNITRKYFETCSPFSTDKPALH
ncbi:hypothetical protein BGZ95_007373, partial [Linnemannia exigua]